MDGDRNIQSAAWDIFVPWGKVTSFRRAGLYLGPVYLTNRNGVEEMRIEDRLKKVEKQLQEHQDVCKICENAIYDVTAPRCAIASQLLYKIDKMKKQIREQKNVH